MLKRLQITDFRGVREGSLDALSRLVVIVGPNGSGKSTILEACAVGGSNVPAVAVGMSVLRRSQTPNGARWLVFGGPSAKEARIHCSWKNGIELRRRLHGEPLYNTALIDLLAKRSLPQPYTFVRIDREHPPPKDGTTESSLAACAANNEFEARDAPHEYALKVPLITFVDPRHGGALHDLFSEAVQAGQRAALVAGVRSVIPALQDLEILTEEGTPRLFLRFERHAVPATLAGDGIASMLRTAFQLGVAPPDGVVLMEEPELHQHPRSLLWCARAIVSAVRRGAQVILTTHSVELIDKLLSELSDEEIGDTTFMSVVRTNLVDGTLHAIAMPAKEAESVRSTVEEDLR